MAGRSKEETADITLLGNQKTTVSVRIMHRMMLETFEQQTSGK